MAHQADHSEPLVEVRGLTKEYRVQQANSFVQRTSLRAVNGVDLSIQSGETLALVGESGSGKSTIGRLLLNLEEPTSGKVLFKGRDLADLKRGQMRTLRREMQMIFQSPYTSLNPRKTIGRILRQPYLTHRLCPDDEVQARIEALLASVGLSDEASYTDRYPHELSGGQRQRIGIARAVSVQPRFVVADEPVSALDMSVRAHVLRLMKRLAEDMDLAYLLITHDLAVARTLAHRIAVLYLGRIVETGQAEAVFTNPQHPYTQGLISATPIPDPVTARARPKIVLRGEIPSPLDPPSGCEFHTRCPFAQPERCSDERPQLRVLADGQLAACHYAEEIADGRIQPSTDDVHQPKQPEAR